MERKKKICAGFNGEEHEDYIYKNIDGKKYCKSCTYKLQPPKPINKVSGKGKFRLIFKQDEFQKDLLFYHELWLYKWYTKPLESCNGERMLAISPKCEICKKRLGEEPKITFFHHILEKRNYPQFRHNHLNIAILCEDCHSSYESNPDSIPALVSRRLKLLNYFRQSGTLINTKNIIKI